jgi:hypothetical protein
MWVEELIRSYEPALWWLLIASLAFFVATLAAVPLLIIRIPADYFARRRRPRGSVPDRHPAVRLVLRVAKSVVGAALILVGVLLLVLPGQGLVTILLGIMLLEFPGKYRLERWLVSRRSVLGFLNWLRRAWGRAPLVLRSGGGAGITEQRPGDG